MLKLNHFSENTFKYLFYYIILSKYRLHEGRIQSWEIQVKQIISKDHLLGLKLDYNIQYDHIKCVYTLHHFILFIIIIENQIENITIYFIYLYYFKFSNILNKQYNYFYYS